jgi:hypothetical protein
MILFSFRLRTPFLCEESPLVVEGWIAAIASERSRQLGRAKHRVNIAVSRVFISLLLPVPLLPVMSAKLRDEIEAKRAKLQELRQARLNRQKHDTERRLSVSPPPCTSAYLIAFPPTFSRHLSSLQHRQM